jgi:hypothetical protein
MTARTNAAPNRPDIAMKAVTTAAFIIFIGIHLLSAFTRPVDPDEWQQLRNSYDLFAGERLYVDFWDNHGPFLTYLQAPWFGFFPQDHFIIVLLRLPHWLVTLAVALFTAAAAREAFPDRPLLPRLSALFVLMAPTYISKAHEVRSDNILNALYVLALYLVLRGFRTARAWHFLAAGLACGLIFGFSIKVLFVGFAFFLIFIMRWWVEARFSIAPMLLFGLGNAVVMAATLAWLHRQGLLAGFFSAYFGANLDREHSIDFEPFMDLLVDRPVTMLLALAALWVAAVRWRRGQAGPSERLLWPAAAFLPFSYFFLLPTHHLQSLLSSHTLVAFFVALMVGREARRVYHSWPLLRRFSMSSQTLAAAALALIVVYHAAGACLLLWSRSAHLQSSISSANALMRLTGPDEMILDGRGLPLYRPKPLFARSLVNHIQNLYNKGALDLDIPARLQANSVRFVVLDRRVSGLHPLLPWLASHYLPMAPVPEVNDRLLVAGTVVRADTSTIPISITIPAEYWVETLPDKGGVVTVDGRESGPWRLEPGTHEVQVRDGVSTVIVSAVPPSRLPHLSEIEGFDLAAYAKRIRESRSSSPAVGHGAFAAGNRP